MKYISPTITLFLLICIRLPAPPINMDPIDIYGSDGRGPSTPSKINREIDTGGDSKPDSKPKPAQPHPHPQTPPLPKPQPVYPGLNDLTIVTNFSKDYPNQNPDTTASTLISGFDLALGLLQEAKNLKSYYDVLAKLDSFKRQLKPGEKVFVNVFVSPEGDASIMKIHALDSPILSNGQGKSLNMQIIAPDSIQLQNPKDSNEQFEQWKNQWSPQHKQWFEDWKQQQQEHPGTNPPPLPPGIPPIPARLGNYVQIVQAPPAVIPAELKKPHRKNVKALRWPVHK